MTPARRTRGRAARSRRFGPPPAPAAPAGGEQGKKSQRRTHEATKTGGTPASRRRARGAAQRGAEARLVALRRVQARLYEAPQELMHHAQLRCGQVVGRAALHLIGTASGPDVAALRHVRRRPARAKATRTARGRQRGPGLWQSAVCLLPPAETRGFGPTGRKAWKGLPDTTAPRAPHQSPTAVETRRGREARRVCRLQSHTGWPPERGRLLLQRW